jgi:peptide deformylase
MILSIIQYPDPVLRSLCKPILEVSNEIKTIINDMYDTLYEASGRGLAGPQIGIANRLFVMDINWKNGLSEPVTMINPEILFKSNETQVNEERCLSIPETPVKVERPYTIDMMWMDEECKLNRKRFEGISAAIICHEIDHLDGKLIVDE